ncbi:MAG: methyltransferase domain-containing protein [Actinomycetota bacterium]|nr:methyltransferase domain-containing protein [Actinomycetota bacterium]
MRARLRLPRYKRGARAYDVVSLERLVYRQGREAAIAALGLLPGARVLDVGCGTGLNLPLLMAAGAGEVVGVDSSAPMLRQARQRVERQGWSHVRLVEGDAAALGSLVDGVVDAVVFTYSLSVVDDWQAAWEQAFGMLRPGGRVAVVDTAMPTGRWRVLAPLARLALFAGGVDESREVWRQVLTATADPTYEVMTGGHVHVAVGTKPPESRPGER